MKKILLVLAIFLAGLFVYNSTQVKENRELNLLIWDNYLAPDTIANFEKKTGATVIIELMKSNEEALAKIKANPGVYDIVVPSDYMVQILHDEQLLTTLDHTKIANISNISPSMKGHYYDADFSYSVPYAFGSAGFAVNTKFVQDTDISWNKLTEPRFKNHIVLMDDMRYVLGSVLLELGLEPNTTKKEDIDAAVTLLKKVLPNVQKITPDTPVDLMVAEGAWVAYGYSGDTFQMHTQNPAITYQIPASGGMQFVDNLVIPAGSSHSQLAHQFIDEILDPQVSADITKETKYGNPNDAAKKFLPDELLKNASVFPSTEALAKLHFVQDLGDNLSLYDAAWQEIKR